MSDYEMNALKTSINKSIGIDISDRCRKRENFYSRVMFFRIIKEKSSNTQLQRMANTVGINHAAVIYSLKAYENLKNYPDFKEIEREIRAIVFDKGIEKGIFCNPITYNNGQK